tara:strand:+ start:734 stop:1291 length:558 start_codon:yes stop_codon:yes gene_type:complete
MIPEENLLMLSSSLLDHKEGEWYSHGIRDIPPKVSIFGRSTPTEGLTIPDSIMSGLSSSGRDLIQIIHYIGEEMYDIWPANRPDMVAIGMESLGRKTTPGTEYIEYVKGDLAKDHATNPASDVFNVLMVAVASDDLVGGCDVQTASLEYHYCDGGLIEWEDPIVAVDSGGQLSDALSSFFQREDA